MGVSSGQPGHPRQEMLDVGVEPGRQVVFRGPGLRNPDTFRDQQVNERLRPGGQAYGKLGQLVTWPVVML